MSTSMTGSRGPSGLSSKGGMTGGNIIPKGYEQGQLSQFTPEQTQLFQQMFGHVGPESYLSRLAGGDEGMFNQLEAPAYREFHGMQGQLGSRFSGMGMGGRHSSGFQNQANAASANFAENMAARRMGLQQNALQELMNMSNQLLGQRPYEQFLIKQQQQPSGFQSFLGSALPIAGAGIGSFGGPMGAAMGAQLGSTFGSSIMGKPAQGNYGGISDLPTKWGT